jgi:hypothetical protein
MLLHQTSASGLCDHCGLIMRPSSTEYSKKRSIKAGSSVLMLRCCIDPYLLSLTYFVKLHCRFKRTQILLPVCEERGTFFNACLARREVRSTGDACNSSSRLFQKKTNVLKKKAKG